MRTVNDLGALAWAEIHGREVHGATHNAIAIEMGRDPGTTPEAHRKAAEAAKAETAKLVAAKAALADAESAYRATTAKADAEREARWRRQEDDTKAMHQAAADYLARAQADADKMAALRVRWEEFAGKIPT